MGRVLRNSRAAMPKNQHLIPLEVFTVNTYENFYRRIVITISVLLIAVWLPLSASALGVTKASDDSQSTEMRVHKGADLDCEHLHLHRSHSRGSDNADGEQIGFAETDPAYGPFSSVAIIRKATENSFSNVLVGFAETDPAGQPVEDTWTLPWVSDNQVHRALVGFAEEDPTANGFQSDEADQAALAYMN
jgi:hypothetical protein